MSTPITALPPTLPANACYGSEQLRVNAFYGGQFFIAGEFNSYVIGAVVPGVADHLKLWFRTTDGRTYFWDGNSWITPYWFDPTALMGASVFLPGKDAAWLLTVDHDGSVAIPGSLDRTGPFWEEDVLMRGKFPLGYGTLQPSGTVIPASGSGSTGGTDQTTLSEGQGALGSHVHPFGNYAGAANDDIWVIKQGSITIPATQMLFVPGSNNGQFLSSFTVADLITGPSYVNGLPVAALDPVALMNPYQAGVFAKRTARKYFSVT